MTKKRKEGRARKKSTSEDYGNDIHFFSLSASCFSRALSAFFLFSLSLFLPRFSVFISLSIVRKCWNIQGGVTWSYLKSFGMIGRNEKFWSSSSSFVVQKSEKNLCVKDFTIAVTNAITNIFFFNNVFRFEQQQASFLFFKDKTLHFFSYYLINFQKINFCLLFCI